MFESGGAPPAPLLPGAPPGTFCSRPLRVSAHWFVRSLGSWLLGLPSPWPTAHALRAYVRAIINWLSPRRAPPD
eukprot:5787121-Prymnesium_polylepis.1